MVARAVHVLIEGRVQGVWFRGWTAQEATSLALSGWVRNRADGRAEAVFGGAATDVADMLERCWRGPPAASVRNVVVSETDMPAPGFRRLPSE